MTRERTQLVQAF